MRATTIRGADLSAELRSLRAELELPADFPPDVLAEAQAAATAGAAAGHSDATDIAFVTLDPPGSRDLDQAFALERRASSGYRFRYAIADVAAFVTPGGAVDRQAHGRGETLYLPDGRIPLHPPMLSEGAASLLPGQVRPAVVWQIDLDADGEPVAVHVDRRLVRSRAQLDYPTFERTGGDLVPLLREIGTLRRARERDRGGVSLAVPEQEVTRSGAGWQLQLRAPVPAEDWNAQLSLLTGMAAARLMLEAGVGLLRTMPPPDAATVGSLRRSALALGVDWPATASYADVVRGLDAQVAAHAAVLRLASVLFRGAGYVAFDGAPPEQPVQSAVAAPYAHVTAPLRRMADRYASECCLAACAGSEVPEWVRAALPALPEEMAAADRRAHGVDRAVVDLAEALLLAGRVGEEFAGVVVEADRRGGGQVQVRQPPVRARLTGDDLPLGHELRVRLVEADVNRRRVTFEPA